MIRTSTFVGVSLDGFLARPDGGLDWLEIAGDEPHGYEEFIASVDALLVGRKTYETALSFGGWPYAGKRVFVLSTKPLAPAPAGADVERLHGEPPAIVAELESRGVRHAYVDGGLVIQSFLRAGMLQWLTVTRLPVLIGEGIPLFGPTGRDVRLRHEATHTYANGLVQSTYSLTPAAGRD